VSDYFLRWILLLEVYGVIFEYLSGKNFLIDALSCLYIDELKILQEESLIILSESEQRKINVYCLVYSQNYPETINTLYRTTPSNESIQEWNISNSKGI
jgi:hypothetical protein